MFSRLCISIVGAALCTGAFLSPATAAPPVPVPSLPTVPSLATPAVSTEPPEATDPYSVTLPYPVVASGVQDGGAATVTLPAGTSPTRLRAKLVANYTRPGVIVVAVGDQVVARPPANTTTMLDVALSDKNLSPDGSVTVSLTTKLEPSDTCFVDDNYTATLSNTNIAYTASPEPPTTIASFLSTGVPKYTVVGTPNPSDAALSAELNAVAALAYRSPTPTQVHYQVTAPPSSATSRVVRIVPTTGTQNVSFVLSKPATLTISGPDLLLPAAASALGSPAAASLQTRRATNVDAKGTFSTLASPVPLAKLGVPTVAMSTVGSASTTVALNAPAFGFETKTLNIHLLGVTSPIPSGGQGRLDFFFNNALVRSKQLSSTQQLDETFTLNTPDVVRNNSLRIQLSYVPPSGKCAPALPALVNVNVNTSTVQAIKGSPTDLTFNSFPQIFQSTIPVLFSNTSTSSRISAANLVTALAAATPTQQLTINAGQNLQTLPLGNGSALIVGASGSDLAALGAPIQARPDLSVVGPTGEVFNAATDPSALLQTFRYKDHPLLVSGHTGGAVGEAREVALSHFVLTNPDGFATLTSSVALWGPSAKIVYIPLPPTPPAASSAPWLVATGVALAIVLALALWLWRRPSTPPPPPLPGVPEEA